MYFSIKKKIKLWSLILIIFKLLKHPFSIEKNTSKLFLIVIFFMFLDLKGSCDQNPKMKANKKLLVEKWPQIFDRINRLGLRIRQRLRTISCFWTFLLNFFFAFLEAFFNHFLKNLRAEFWYSFVNFFLFVLDYK